MEDFSSSRRSSRGSEEGGSTSMEGNSGDELPLQDNNRSSQLQPFESVMDGQSLTAIPITKTHAAFVSKLYNMVEDQEIQDLITWSETGDVFRVFNPTAFSKNVLPRYFKHNNWQSFVRQLNMYGFNKVNDMIHSNLRNENQIWEFRHPHFRRGEVSDLRNIKRKSVRSLRATAPLSVTDSDLQRSEMLHQNYANLVDRVTRMNAGFETLMDEVAGLRDIVIKQQEYMEGIIQALDVICSAIPGGSTDELQAQLKALRERAAAVVHLTQQQNRPRQHSYQQHPWHPREGHSGINTSASLSPVHFATQQQQPLHSSHPPPPQQQKMERLPSISVHPYIEDTPMSTPSRRTSFHDTIMPDVEIQNTSNSSNTSSSIRQTNTVSSSSKSGSTDYFPVDRPLMTTTTTITTTTIRPTPLQSSSMMGLGKQSQLLNPLPPSDDEDGTILNDDTKLKRKNAL